MEVFGRDQERGRVDSFLESLITSGSASLLLEGEPGIGKTTMWRAGLQAAEARGYCVLASRPAEAEASLSYAGVADILTGVDGTVLDALPDPQRLALDVALLRRDAGARPPEPRAVFAALVTILRLLAEERPCVVAVDDLQWLDGPSARSLAFAGRRLDQSPVGLLSCVRTDGEAGAKDASGWFERSERIRLKPLSAAALHRVVKERHGWSMPRPTLLRLHRACGGNAFFALEIAGALVESGLDDLHGPLPIPDDVRQLVERRVRRLPTAARRDVLKASAASQPTTDLFVPATLRTAQTAGIVAVAPGGRVRFTHPLYASAIYLSASPAELRELHADLALRFDDPEERARHLGLATPEPDEQVAAELDRAADFARSRGAPETAAELQERAFELTPSSDRASVGRRALTSAVEHFHAGSLGRASALLEDLLEEPVQVSARALRLLALIRFREESYGEAIGLLHSAVAAADDIPELRAPVELDLTMVALAVSLDHEVARPHADAALAHAERSSDTALISHALAGKLIADFLLGEGIDDERLARALELEDLDAESAIEVRPTLAAGFLALYTGDFERARVLLYPLRARLIERGEDTDLPLLSLHLAWLECWAGNYAAAKTLADEGLQTAVLGGTMTAHALALSSLLDAHTGDVEQCRERVGAARASMGGAEFCLVVQWSCAALGLLELSLGDAAAAHRALGDLAEFFEPRRLVEPIHLTFLPDEIEALIALGQLERAERLTELLAASGVALDRPWALATGARCRAMLHAAEKDIEAAGKAIDQALAEQRRVSMPLELARTLICKGQIERRSKAKAAARESLELGLAICDEIGARLWADRARAELARLGERRDPDELTATEERVAALAASGLTNREVAAAAFMSQKTVEANLSRIYRKLGIRSRAELGVRLAVPAKPRAPTA